MSFKLHIEKGGGRGEAFDFDESEVSIGRGDENAIVLDDGGVSRRHALISVQDGRHVLSDLGTSNGTFLNGRKIEKEPLENGDRFRVGAVEFRFELTTAENSTRIVSLAAGERVPAKGKKKTKELPAAPAKARSGKGRGLSVAVVGVLVLVGAGLVVSRMGSSQDEGAGRCPTTLELEDLQSYVFGNNTEAACTSGSVQAFGFRHASGTRALLHFAPFFTDKDELEVKLNGKRIASAQINLSRSASRQVIVLPASELKPGEANIISFENRSGGDWGIERLELEEINLAQADAGQASEAYARGTKLYSQRNIAAPNLYNAWIELRTARRYMEGLDPKPDTYGSTLDLLRSIERELDKLCANKMFAGAKEAHYNRYDRANEIYRFLLAAFPGEAHPCHARAQASMYLID